MAIEYAALKAEAADDPERLGLAEHIKAGSDLLVAALLNAVREGENFRIREPLLTAGEFQLAVLQGILKIDGLDETRQRKWSRLLGVVQSVSVIPTGRPEVTALLSEAVADGLLTAEEASGVGVRQGSRAEVLFGAGVVVSADDVARALRGV